MSNFYQADYNEMTLTREANPNSMNNSLNVAAQSLLSNFSK